MRRTTLLTCFSGFFFLVGSTQQLTTISFDEPIDALSVRLPHDDAQVAVKTPRGWHQFVIEKEFDPLLKESDLVMFPEAVNRVVVRGDISQIDLHPIMLSNAPASYELAATTFYRKPSILKRSQWGANDEWLYAGPEVERSDEPSVVEAPVKGASTVQSSRVDDCTTAQRDHPEDFRVANTITHDAQGRRLRWAQRQSPDVKLLVVHHTALEVNGDDRSGLERVRALYEYHANSRGWGDVGYHYIIDENGVIYEGRAGGDSVVGGHVYCGNVGTQGIALLGDFTKEQPTQKQVQSLQYMLDYLANLHDIDLRKSVTYKGQLMQPIVRHKDLISTQCPGYYLSSAFNQVVANVRNGNLLASVTFPTIQTTAYKDRTETRLATRLREAGQSLSRTFYRAKRLMRTAQRQDSTKLQHLQTQLTSDTSSDVQRRRAARLARRNRVVTQHTPTPNAQRPNPNHIRIRLSYTGNIAEVRTGNQTVRLGKEGDKCFTNDQLPMTNDHFVRLGSATSISEITSWNTQNNRFRGIIECRIVDGQLTLINEVSLENYLKGLAEEPDTEPFEKQKAFAVAARSYAAHYMEDGNRKFPGKPYDGDDSPARFQKYGGVNFEENNARWVDAVEATSNVVLKVGDDIVKAAYYSSNDGRTRSPEENGWRNFPHTDVFQSKPDPWCSGFELRGHGVGMSGCGAEGQAEDGKTFTQILKYYYPGTLITQR